MLFNRALQVYTPDQISFNVGDSTSTFYIKRVEGKTVLEFTSITKTRIPLVWHHSGVIVATSSEFTVHSHDVSQNLANKMSEIFLYPVVLVTNEGVFCSDGVSIDYIVNTFEEKYETIGDYYYYPYKDTLLIVQTERNKGFFTSTSQGFHYALRSRTKYNYLNGVPVYYEKKFDEETGRIVKNAFAGLGRALKKEGAVNNEERFF